MRKTRTKQTRQNCVRPMMKTGLLIACFIYISFVAYEIGRYSARIDVLESPYLSYPEALKCARQIPK